MKQLYLSVLLCLLAFQSYAQPQLSSQQWQQDLDYLQKLVHKQYAPLFHRTTPEAFDKAVADLHQTIPGMQAHEIMVGIAKLLATFKYGHTGMSLFQEMHGETLKTGFHILPVNLYQFSDGVYIQATHKDYTRALGAKILRIGNMSIEEALKAIEPVVSIENPQFFKGYGVAYLTSPEVLHAQRITSDLKEVTMLLEKDGKQFNMTFDGQGDFKLPHGYEMIQTGGDWVDSRNQDGDPLWLKELQKAYHVEYLKDQKTVYVRQSQVRDDGDETIAGFYRKVFDFVEAHEVDRFILDLRSNGGGNNYKNKPVIVGLIRSKINEKGKFFTIIGRRTFSAAQNLVNELEKYTNVTFVGEPTAESVNFFGDVNMETLPNSQLQVRLSFMWWQDNDPRDTRKWTAPEVPATMSFEDYKLNHDPVLSAALNYQAPGMATISTIKASLLKNDIEEAKSVAQAFVQDAKNAHIRFESLINTLGYSFLNDGDTPQAIAAFDLNTQLYPESPNVWDSLAEGHLSAGNNEKAIAYYQKTYEMDKEGRVGIHAKEMIVRIKNHANDN